MKVFHGLNGEKKTLERSTLTHSGEEVSSPATLAAGKLWSKSIEPAYTSREKLQKLVSLLLDFLLTSLHI